MDNTNTLPEVEVTIVAPESPTSETIPAVESSPAPPKEEKEPLTILPFSKRGPKILIPSGQTKIHESIESLWKALSPHGFYFSGGEVVTIERSKKGHAKMAALTSNSLASQVTAFGSDVVEQQMTKEGLKQRTAQVSSELAAKALASPAVKKILPPLEMIHSSPLLIEEENNPRHPKILRPGYHHENGGRFISGGAAQDIPFSEAKGIIAEIFAEYDFASEADRARAFAALIMPAVRFGGIAGFKQPIAIIEADMSQGGKTFFCKLIHAVYGETCSVVTQIDRGVGSTDESLKSALVTGKPFVLLDNIRGAMDTRWLEAAITSDDEIACRVPGAAREVDPNNFIFQLTSNGFVASPDLLNRACVIKIKRRPGHAYREYKEGDGELPDYIRAKQGRYLGAVYSILKQWIIAGKPRTADTRIPGTLRKWWQAADWICQNLLQMPCPVDGWADTAKRAANPELTWLRSVAIAVLGDTDYKGEPLLLEEVRQSAESAQVETPGLTERTPMSQRNPIVGNLVARIFKRCDRVEIDGMEVVCSVERVARADGKGYRNQKFLTFAKVVPVPTTAVEEVPASEDETVYAVDKLLNSTVEYEKPVKEEEVPSEEAASNSFIDRLAEEEIMNTRKEDEPATFHVEEEKEDFQSGLDRLHENSMAFLALEDEVAHLLPRSREKPPYVPAKFKSTPSPREEIIRLLRICITAFDRPKTRGEYMPRLMQETGLPAEKIHDILDSIQADGLANKPGACFNFLELIKCENRDEILTHFVGGNSDLTLAN